MAGLSMTFLEELLAAIGIDAAKALATSLLAHDSPRDAAELAARTVEADAAHRAAQAAAKKALDG